MSSQATQKDEDLIILGDESSTDNSILDFNFNLDNNSSDASNPLITFGEDAPATVSYDSFDSGFGSSKEVEAKATQTPNSLVSDDKVKQSSGDDSIDLGFWIPSKENEVYVKEEVKASDKVNSSINESISEDALSSKSSFSGSVLAGISDSQEGLPESNDSEGSVFDDSSIKQAKTSSEATFLNESLGDRNDILNWTIKKLEQRKQVISQIKKAKQASVDKLNEHISKLKRDVSSLQSEIKGLEREEISIESDIAQVEKMKTSNSEAENSTSRSRKHNLGNIKN